jgi:hypothetical protein
MLFDIAKQYHLFLIRKMQQPKDKDLLFDFACKIKIKKPNVFIDGKDPT